MLPDSVYFGYYGNNDWRDYVEHSLGSWKNKAVKYIDKVVGLGGKVRYIYDKNWGKNKSKEYYRTQVIGDTKTKLKPIKTANKGEGIDDLSIHDYAKAYRRSGIKNAGNAKKTTLMKYFREGMSAKEVRKQHAEFGNYGFTGKVGNKEDINTSKILNNSIRRKTSEEAKKLLLDEARRKKKRGVSASVKKKMLVKDVSDNAYYGTSSRRLAKKPKTVKYGESFTKG